MSKMLDRLSKVLAQADNASTPEEREAYMAKAMELSAISAIDLAVARAHQADKTKVEMPEERAVTVNDYGRKRCRDYFMTLFIAIAGANDCKVLIGNKSYRGYALGFPSDIDVIEALYGTLSVQMETEADAALKRGENKRSDEAGSWSVVDGRVWRREFYDGFTARIRARLWATKRAAEKQAGVTSDASSSTAVALRNKQQEVADFYEKEYGWRRSGTWSPSRSSGSDFTGTAREAGHAAGARASLGNDDDTAMSGSNRKAI